MDETSPPLILVVDDSRTTRTALVQELSHAGYRTCVAADGDEALALVRQEPPDLVLLDVVMPGMNGHEVCRRLKAEQSTILIPVVMITSLQKPEERLKGLEAGADDFLTRPHSRPELLTRVRSLLRLRRYTQELENVETVLFALAMSVEARDPFTVDHCERLSRLAVAVGQRIGMATHQLTALRRAALLHDLGKIAVPDAILLKPGPLSPAERAIMEQHPVVGERICSPLQSLRSTLPIVRHHHERWDGSGYPDGLSGESVPLPARVLQLADIYDALTHARPYKVAHSRDTALEIMRDEAARGWREPSLLSAFIEVSSDLSLPDGEASARRRTGRER